MSDKPPTGNGKTFWAKNDMKMWWISQRAKWNIKILHQMDPNGRWFIPLQSQLPIPTGAGFGPSTLGKSSFKMPWHPWHPWQTATKYQSTRDLKGIEMMSPSATWPWFAHSTHLPKRHISLPKFLRSAIQYINSMLGQGHFNEIDWIQLNVRTTSVKWLRPFAQRGPGHENTKRLFRLLTFSEKNHPLHLADTTLIHHASLLEKSPKCRDRMSRPLYTVIKYTKYRKYYTVLHHTLPCSILFISDTSFSCSM